MQCYERQAMVWKLNADAVREVPQLQFDPFMLNEVLSEFSINSFAELIELDQRKLREIISHIETIGENTDSLARSGVAARDRGSRKGSSVHFARIPGQKGKGLTTSPTIFP
ncbi:MAG: hypothetical protein ACU843_08025 [Gammaproteobacteria bacterium]